jgi:biopolymer transport protein ExbD
MSSHGHHDYENCEPNLMPLLDVVMQLLMFFILCADLKQANRKNPYIALPPAAAAVPNSPSGDGMIYVNIKPFKKEDFTYLEPEVQATLDRLFPPATGNGQTICFIVPASGHRKPMNKDEFESWLQSYITLQKNTAAAAKDAKPPEMIVAVRAAGVVQYQYVLETLQFCSKKQGLKTVTTVNTRVKGNS